MSEKKFIDIRKLLKEKNPKLEKWIPGFIIGYLKKIFHQEEINRILIENKDLEVRAFCNDLQKRFGLQFKGKGLENVPTSGGAIFVANHPLGGFDALGVVQTIAPIRTDLKFVVNDVMMNIKNIESLMVGVNKHGVKSKESIEKVNELFLSDKAAFIFPAGLVSRRKNGKVIDSEWKKTFVVRAKKFKKEIIPIHIDGELSSFFYRLSNMRKRLGVKANVEMLYLANETFKLKNSEFTITVGKPISYKMFDKSKSDNEWANEVKRIVYGLKK
ncbi:MAG: glycerol acyltransferase [Crocinitomicaceae bacterium]|nr:glycerol acyltransferase [Crocinitomicaceae bacterium]